MRLRLATHCMGTRFELVLHGDDEHFLRAAGEAALAEIEDCDARFSVFRPDSLLARINRDAGTRWVGMDAEAFTLFALCDEVAVRSGFAFDPTIAPRMRELGFHDRACSDGDVVVGWRHVELDPTNHAIRFRRSGVSLDLGGVAKGFGLDRAADALREEGVSCAFAQGGTSTMIALGAPPADTCWRVALADDPRAPIAQLRDTALSVSAPHGRTIRHEGDVLTHVLDPATGRPVANGVARVAVLGDSAAATDAWSTALLVRGHELDVPDDCYSLVADQLDWHGDESRFEQFHQNQQFA